MSRASPANCSGLANSGVPTKPPGVEIAVSKTRFSDRLRQTEIDNFCRDTAVILQTHHDVTRFDVPVNEVLFVHRSQPGGHLRCNFQRQLYLRVGLSV